MTDPTCDFRARIVFDETIVEIDVFVWELRPVNEGLRPRSEWVREHLESWQLQDYVANFNDPCVGPFEVVFKGTIRGFKIGPYSDMWDEEVVVHDHMIQPLPEQWFS